MPFTGFPPECVEFYQSLKKNNNKAWFDRHKDNYEQYVLNPSREFVAGMGKLLKKISPGIHADPRVNKSLFKIFRDTRFSNDKTPFKTNLGIWFWEGEGKRFDFSGFYFHVEPPNMMLAAGIHVFDGDRLKLYRDSVIHETRGPQLFKAVKQVEKAGYQIGEKYYKTTPKGYDSDHKNAEYLKYNCLHAYHWMKIPKEFYKPELIDFSFKVFKAMAPIHHWLANMTGKVK